MPTDYANDPTLGRMLSQLAYAVIWSGRIPKEAQPIWTRQMESSHGAIVSARMAGYIGRAGADLLRADSEGQPDGMNTTISGIVTAAFLLKPGHVLDAIQDVLERLDVDVRDGICPDVAYAPTLIEEELDRLIDARGPGVLNSELGLDMNASLDDLPSIPLPPGPQWDLYGLYGLDRWSDLSESAGPSGGPSVRSKDTSPIFIHPSHTWSVEDLIAVRLRWKSRRSMGLC